MLTIGVLCKYRKEFDDFAEQNKALLCIFVSKIEDFDGVTFDMFIRLHSAEQLDTSVHVVACTQERLRNLNKDNYKETNEKATSSKNLQSFQIGGSGSVLPIDEPEWSLLSKIDFDNIKKNVEFQWGAISEPTASIHQLCRPAGASKPRGVANLPVTRSIKDTIDAASLSIFSFADAMAEIDKTIEPPKLTGLKNDFIIFNDLQGAKYEPKDESKEGYIEL